MTIEEIKELKDRVYELEGLLELAQMREDKISELEPLIKERVKALAEEAGEESSNEVKTAMRTAEETKVASEPENMPEAEPVSIDYPSLDRLETVSDEEEFEDEAGVEIAAARQNAPSGKPAFCLNDRFRFRRELFNNSDSGFAVAMNQVASMDSYEEAEEYFLGGLGWDPENENVQDFLTIIRNYFER